MDERPSALSRALRLLTHLNLLAPCGGSNCRVIISPHSPAECCCLGVTWESWANAVSVGLLVAFARVAQPPTPDPAVLSHLLLFCISCAFGTNCQCLFGGSIPFPWDGLFHLCQKAVPVSLTCCTLGCRLPMARCAGESLGPRRKGGLTWAHGALWGVLLRAGSAEKCVL